MTGAVKGGICLCLAKSHNHNAIIITWDDLDSNPNSAMLCSSGGNQLMSIQGFQMSFFLGHSFSQSRRNGVKHCWKVTSCLPQSYLEPQKRSIPTATGLIFERQNQKGSLEEGDSLCFYETGVIDLLLQAQQHFIEGFALVPQRAPDKAVRNTSLCEELSPELNWMEKSKHKFKERISVAWICDSEMHSSYHAYK